MTPADTIRRAADELKRDVEKRPITTGGAVRDWQLHVADAWTALAAEMADYPAVRVKGGIGIAYRPEEPSAVWTATYNAARAYLGEVDSR